MPAAGTKFWAFLALKGVPSASLLVYNNLSACHRQKIFDLFGFEQAASASLSLLVHNNNISARRRHKIFGLFGF